MKKEIFFSLKNGICDKSTHFKSIMNLLISPNFDYMVTFLKDFRVPRSGNSESLIRLYRQWEKIRFGFRSDKGRLDHLKLFQISYYFSLKQNNIQTD